MADSIYVHNNSGFELNRSTGSFDKTAIGGRSTTALDPICKLVLASVAFACGVNAQPYAYVAAGAGYTVSVVNTANSAVVGSISVPGPGGLAVTPDGAYVYVTSQTVNAISVISTATNSVAATIDVGAPQVQVAFSPNGAQAYVVDQSANKVSVINTASKSMVGNIPVGNHPYAVAFSPDGSRAFATNSWSNTVSVIDTASRTVINTFSTPFGPSGVVVSPNGSLLYVANAYSDSVTVHSTTSGNTVATIPGLSYPSWLSMTPNGSRLYVANTNGASVSVIDTSSNTVTSTIGVGNSPTWIAISPDGTRAYVTNQNSFTLSVIDTASRSVINTLSGVGLYPNAVAMLPPSGGQPPVPVNTPPTADSVTEMLPNSLSQTLTFKYSSVNGYAYLSSVYALINGGIRASAGCYAYYLRGTKTLVLVNDTGTGVVGVLTPGGAGTLSNSQCSIDGPSSSVVESGNTLSLTMAMTFKAAFVGTQTLYGLAFDNANLNSAWKTLGTWTSGSTVAIPPTTDSVTPNAGSGMSQHFTFNYSSLNGYRYLNAMYALINGSLSGAGGCWAYFLRGGNELALVNDAGNGVVGMMIPGTPGTLSNSQCSIDGPTSSAVGSGNTLSLTLAVTFKPSFSGTQTFYGLAVDNANLYNGWKTLGTWTSH